MWNNFQKNLLKIESYRGCQKRRYRPDDRHRPNDVVIRLLISPLIFNISQNQLWYIETNMFSIAGKSFNNI